MDRSRVYGSVHRVILQYIISRGIVNYKTLESRIKKLMPNDPIKLDIAINTINENIHSFNQRIKICQCELTGETFCVFVCTVEKDYHKKYKPFTDPQEAYLVKIVNSVVESGNGFIGSIDVLNISSCLKEPVTKSVAEEYVNLFVDKGYLLMNDTGKYCLSPLALSEFETYILDNLSSLVSCCTLCKRIALVNSKCLKCGEVVHNHCLEKYSNMREGTTPVCPACKHRW